MFSSMDDDKFLWEWRLEGSEEEKEVAVRKLVFHFYWQLDLKASSTCLLHGNFTSWLKAMSAVVMGVRGCFRDEENGSYM